MFGLTTGHRIEFTILPMSDVRDVAVAQKAKNRVAAFRASEAPVSNQ
jgi:hypothetical protein